MLPPTESLSQVIQDEEDLNRQLHDMDFGENDELDLLADFDGEIYQDD